MPSTESDALLPSTLDHDRGDYPNSLLSVNSPTSTYPSSQITSVPHLAHQVWKDNRPRVLIGLMGILALILSFRFHLWSALSPRLPTGPYRLVEVHQGPRFWDYYDFYQGDDSLGSAGFNVYVSKQRAMELNLANVTMESGEPYIFLQSTPNEHSQGYRQSIRLEGKRRFDRGLFILDLVHMPVGCGVWPAFWMTDEKAWPDHGEIDIVEGINMQTVAKTALHASGSCSMFGHVPPTAKTGTWDTATGLPDTYTGTPNYWNRIETDNCWILAPHQWENQGCIAVNDEDGTLGEPLNQDGGGVFVMEWDPVHGYIRSWAFRRGHIPQNLREAMHGASNEKVRNPVIPKPDTWGLPYGYFAIGEHSGCSSDHFQNMRIVINLAFCGVVSGNRFFGDCPVVAQQHNKHDDPVLTCNAYVESEPQSLSEAYWKIRGVYAYERELQK